MSSNYDSNVRSWNLRDTLASTEDFVGKLANQKTTTFADAPAQQSPSTNEVDGGNSNTVGLDEIHIVLPNGISFEVSTLLEFNRLTVLPS